LDWLSFLEAISHVARFKPLPKASDLQAAGLRDVTALLESLLGAPPQEGGVTSLSIASSQNSSEKDRAKEKKAFAEKWNGWLDSKEKLPSRPDSFPQRLEHVIKFMFYMLERGGQ
jgi:hypothetical protein